MSSSEYGKGGASSGSTTNLYRSQSMASLAGDKLVLGEGFRGSYTLMRPQKAAAMKELGLNAKALSRIPKTPRPSRALDVFDSVIKGLRYCEKWNAAADILLVYIVSIV